MDTQKELYREEAYELLAVLEDSLLELERNPADMETVGRVFRAMHTIKGSGAMFGFEDIAAFTHTIETVYDLVREGTMTVTQELISLTLEACDRIKSMLGASQGGEDDRPARTRELTEAFGRFLPADQGAAPAAPAVVHAVSDKGPAGRNSRTYRIRFKPHRDLFANGTNPIPLIRELKALGECSIVCLLDDLPELKDLDPEACYTAWDMILTTDQDMNTVRDVFIFVEDLSDIDVELIDVGAEVDPEYKKVGEILVEKGDLDRRELEDALQGRPLIGEMLVDAGKVTKADLGAALVEQEHVRGQRKQRQDAQIESSIRVASPKLDALVNLAGELVTVQAHLSRLAALDGSSELVGVAEEVEQLSAELRDLSMGIRMLPIGTTFAKFKRLVRDLSAELGKEITLATEGEETELDKTVIERLSDPLVHLIRNSIDHGIEAPEVREASGKPGKGTIKLKAAHAGAQVVITISDDGAGLDTEAIRHKAVNKGLIAPDAQLSEHQIHELIMTPGFSTAESITSVSGRGVGMDVVKSNIEALRGSVEVTSVVGSGTTITLKLPLTLAIIDGLLVSIACEHFVIPLSTVVECVDLTQDDLKRAHGRNLVRVRDEIIPYIHLRETFGLARDSGEAEQVVVTEVGEQRVGFVVDKVIGQHQTVIKNLGRMFKTTEGISGATIMGDGAVALILDMHKLTQQAQRW
ncbi:MAG: chemotaxis protein CheA [Syntrophaceae bacterium]